MPAPDDLDPEDYLGLSGEQARALAAERGWLPRVVAPGQMMTMDFREERLNLMVDDGGTVTQAYAG